jgi:hypothetical protein
MNIRKILGAATAVFFGLITLLGYILPFKPLIDLSGGILYAAVFLSSLAMMVGVINLSRVHMRKALTGKPGGAYSLVLFLSLWLTFVIVVTASSGANPNSVSVWIVRNMQIPLEASLSALVIFVLMVGGVRLLYRRRDLTAFLFLGSALIVLAAALPIPTVLEGWLRGPDQYRQMIASIFMSIASGGGRGILLGMALGAAATGLRILIGIDRPYER